MCQPNGIIDAHPLISNYCLHTSFSPLVSRFCGTRNVNILIPRSIIIMAIKIFLFDRKQVRINMVYT